MKKKNNNRYENQNEFNGNKIASILISNGIKDFSYLQVFKKCLKVFKKFDQNIGKLRKLNLSDRIVS